MHKKFVSIVLGLALGAGYVSAVIAQAKPEVLVKQRQAAMVLQGKYFGPLNGMATGKAPYNAEVAARNAAFLDTLSQMAWDGFDPSTKNEKSRALPAIYDNPSKFKEAQEQFRAAARKLAAAKDEGAFKSAAAEVNKACGSCHDDFREKR